MSDETDDVLEGADDQILAIDEALADFAEHKVHVPEAYMPEHPLGPTIGSMSHAGMLAYLGEVGIETLSYDMVILDEASGWERQRERAGWERQRERAGWERQRERVYFPGEDRPRWLDELDFNEAPLFGRQDAGLDDLEPDGPIHLEFDAPTFDYAVSGDEDPGVLPATPGQALLQQLGRTLRACAASVSSRIPGRRS